MSILDSFEEADCRTPSNRPRFSSKSTSPDFVSPSMSVDSPGQASTVYSANGENSSSVSEDSFGDESRKFQGVGDRRNAEISAVIKEHGRRGDLSACWKVWNGLGFHPNEITLGCMVDALVSNQIVDEAETLVNQWKRRGVLPNTVVYSTLIHGWAKQNNAARAMAIFDQMKREQVQCNAVTYNCMIHACVRAGEMQCALDLLYSMKAGVRPDKFTYSTIIKGYCGQGDIDNALFLFESMLSENLVPDLVIYNTLLDGCVKTRYNEMCDKLLDEMITQWGICPNSYTLSILIKRYGRQGDLIRAIELVELFPRKYGFRANAHVWTCLISACVSHGRFSIAEAVYRSMLGDLKAAKAILTTDGGIEYSRADQERAVDSALALASICPPDAKTFETLIHGYMRYNQVRRAMDVLNEGARRLAGRHDKYQHFNQQLVNQVLQANA